jgi:hypothetical protein
MGLRRFKAGMPMSPLQEDVEIHHLIPGMLDLDKALHRIERLRKEEHVQGGGRCLDLSSA